MPDTVSNETSGFLQVMESKPQHSFGSTEFISLMVSKVAAIVLMALKVITPEVGLGLMFGGSTAYASFRSLVKARSAVSS